MTKKKEWIFSIGKTTFVLTWSWPHITVVHYYSFKAVLSDGMYVPAMVDTAMNLEQWLSGASPIKFSTTVNKIWRKKDPLFAFISDVKRVSRDAIIAYQRQFGSPQYDVKTGNRIIDPKELRPE